MDEYAVGDYLITRNVILSANLPLTGINVIKKKKKENIS